MKYKLTIQYPDHELVNIESDYEMAETIGITEGLGLSYNIVPRKTYTYCDLTGNTGTVEAYSTHEAIAIIIKNNPTPFRFTIVESE